MGHCEGGKRCQAGGRRMIAWINIAWINCLDNDCLDNGCLADDRTQAMNVKRRQRPNHPGRAPLDRGEVRPTDWYLRAVLTVISLCLILLVAQGGLLPAHSQAIPGPGVTKVAICDPTGTTCLPLLQDINGANGIRVFTGKP